MKKNEKGITLSNLILYVLMFTIVLALLVSLTNYIFGNLRNVNNESISSEEFNKFNSKFITDIKQSSQITSIEENQGNYTFVLSNGANYNYVKNEKTIYRNYRKIAKNICVFKIENATINEKAVAKVTIGTGKNANNPVYGKTINYVLKYW